MKHQHIIIIFMLLVFFVAISSVYADDTDTVSIRLQVEVAGTTLYDDTIEVSECPITDDIATTTLNARCALEQSGLSSEWSIFGDDYFLDSLSGYENDFGAGLFWNWWSEYEYGLVALNKHILSEGEHLLLTFDVLPFYIELSDTEPTVDDAVTVTAYEFGFDESFNAVWTLSEDAVIYYGIVTTSTDTNGEAYITVTSTTSFEVYGEKSGYIESDKVIIEPRAPTALLTVRNGSIVGFSDTITLADSEADTVEMSPTGTTTKYTVPARSVLSTLVTANANSDSFEITDLQYFNSFNSFFVNCITLLDEEACGSWQYRVNDTYPFVGMDAFILSDGDVVYVYFGSPRRTVLATTTVQEGEMFTARAESYEPETDTYTSASGYTIGVTQENPDNPFDPIVIATSTTDIDGEASFSIESYGDYTVGIAEDFYFPSVPLTVLPAGDDDNGGGGGTEPHDDELFDVPSAFSFLIAQQNDDGSFFSNLLTDWVAIAFGLSEAPQIAKSKLADYLESAGISGSLITDYERRAMALMALGINPYTGTNIDYITPIVSAFDGSQIGDISFVNDDIFGLIALSSAGYSSGDEVISETTAFLVSEQRVDGSWEGSVDLTTAAVQALVLLSDVSGVEESLESAEEYLRVTQGIDGGWGNSFSTSWAMQAISAFGDTFSQWRRGDISPDIYLAGLQEEDGGMEEESEDVQTRIWATAYAIPAAEGITWSELLEEFSKPFGDSGDNDGGGNDTEEHSNSEVLGEATTTVVIAEKNNEDIEMFPTLSDSDSDTNDYTIEQDMFAEDSAVDKGVTADDDGKEERVESAADTVTLWSRFLSLRFIEFFATLFFPLFAFLGIL